MLLRFCYFSTLIYLLNAGQINNLPGAPSVLFKQYSSYLDAGEGNFFHYWFVESQTNPATDPVILWLTGGPGCSSLSALLTENGPFTVNPDGTTLSINKYSWNLKANVLFLESPAGVGFSYAEDGNVNTGDKKVAYHNANAVVQFFNEFPQFRNNDFYVTGESYGGMYVPTLVEQLLDSPQAHFLKLKGFAIGNGELSYDMDTDTLMQYAYNHGLVDELTWRRVERECCEGDIAYCPFHSYTDFGFCSTFVSETTDKCWYGGINPYNMFATCESEEPNLHNKKRFYQEAKFKTGKIPPPLITSVICLNESAATHYLNLPETKTALFVHDNSVAWEMCSDAVGDYYTREFPDMTPQFKKAIAAGLRILIYNGDGDMACNFLMGQRFLENLGYPLTSSKRWFKVNGQVGGFHTKYGNIDFVVVTGAGHMVPTDKPEVGVHILDAFINNRNP